MLQGKKNPASRRGHALASSSSHTCQKRTPAMAQSTTEPSFTGQKPPFASLPIWLRGKATAYEIAILWVLQSYWPEIRPSHHRIAEETGLSRRTVQRVLAGMERKGWIGHSNRFFNQGGKAANLYELMVWDGYPTSKSLSGISLTTAAAVAEQNPHLSDASHRRIPCVTETHTMCHTDAYHASERRIPCVTQTHELDKQELDKTELDQHELFEEAQLAQRPQSPPAPAPQKNQVGEQVEISAESKPASRRKTSKAVKGRQKAQEGASSDSGVSLPLPACAEPFKAHLAAWWRQRSKAHPKLSRVGLSRRDVNALEYAEQRGVLEQFCEIAAASTWQSLGFNGYRQYIEKLVQDESVDGSIQVLNGRGGHTGSRTVPSGQPYTGPLTRGAAAIERAKAMFAHEQCSNPTNSSSYWEDLQSAYPWPKPSQNEDSPLPGDHFLPPPSQN